MSQDKSFKSLVVEFYSKHLKESDDKFAKEYLKMFYGYTISPFPGDDPTLYNPIESVVNKELKRSGENVIAISSDNDSLASLTKRVPLIAERTILSHSEGESLIHVEAYYDPMTSDWFGVYATVPDLTNLGKWLKSCKELITEGVVGYFPNNIRCVESYHNSLAGGPSDSEVNYPYIPDLVVRERLVSEITNDKIPINKYIIPIITLDLPYVENPSLETFSKILIDEQMSISMLREFLKEQFLSIADEEGSEAYFTKVESLKIEIRRGVTAITKDMKALNKKRAFLASSATIATMAATLVAINSDLFEQWVNIAGTSGGLFLFHKLLENSVLEKQKIKDSPFYYLWVLHNSPA